ncbi:10737_t:CDS:2, partial [Rhizophagus irregularis]
MSKHFFHCFGHIHLENENDAGTFFSKVRDGEFCVEGRPINFLASRQAGSKDPILYKIDETITSTIEPPTILNEPTTSKPSISIENFKEFGTGRLVEFLRNDKNLSELKLDDNFFMKIMEENIPRRTFLKLTKSDLRECGVRLDPSLELEEYIQELGVKKECQKILKQVAEERTNHEAENAELRSRIKELENGRTDTVAECEKADMSGEKEKKLLRETASEEEEEKHAIEISPNNDCPNRDIISLYKDTREAKVDVIKSNREFKSMYKDFMANNNAGKKKAKGQ